MVLRLRTLAFFASVAVLSSARAQTFVDLTFEKGGCKLLTQDPKTKKLTTAKFKFPAGTKTQGYDATGQTVMGTKPAEKLKPFVVRHPKNPKFLFLVSGNCAFPNFLAKPTPVAEPEPVYAEDPPEAPVTFVPHSTWIATAGSATFRLNPSLVGPDGTAYPMNAVAFGGLVGAGWEHRGVSWGYGVEAQIIYAKTQGAIDTDAGVTIPAGLEYEAKNVTVFNMALAPGFRFRPRSGEVGVGLQIPLAFTSASWPVGDGYTVTGAKFNYGLLFDLRFERGDWVLAQKFGPWGGLSLKKFYWAFELSYAL